MTRIAVSGHRGLSAHTTGLVDAAIREKLSAHERAVLTGMSCLADGADQIFARVVVELGGALEVVIPAQEYRAGLPADALPAYDHLLSRAVIVHRLPYVHSTAEAHMAASEFMVDRVSELYAVWDGQPARGYGGTADVVGYARECRKIVQVIWPQGAERD
jgi:hypothetical protein